MVYNDIMLFDSPKDKEFHTLKPEEYDLTRVKLCIVGYLLDNDNNQYNVPLQSLTSTTLYDRGMYNTYF